MYDVDPEKIASFGTKEEAEKELKKYKTDVCASGSIDKTNNIRTKDCIFRKNCASVPEERSAIPLQTEQSSAG